MTIRHDPGTVEPRPHTGALAFASRLSILSAALCSMNRAITRVRKPHRPEQTDVPHATANTK
jgi:hypothetical protein